MSIWREHQLLMEIAALKAELDCGEKDFCLNDESCRRHYRERYLSEATERIAQRARAEKAEARVAEFQRHHREHLGQALSPEHCFYCRGGGRESGATAKQVADSGGLVTSAAANPAVPRITYNGRCSRCGKEGYAEDGLCDSCFIEVEHIAAPKRKEEK